MTEREHADTRETFVERCDAYCKETAVYNKHHTYIPRISLCHMQLFFHGNVRPCILFSLANDFTTVAAYRWIRRRKSTFKDRGLSHSSNNNNNNNKTHKSPLKTDANNLGGNSTLTAARR